MPIVFFPTSARPAVAFKSGLQRLVQLRRIPANLPVSSNALPVYNLGVRDVLAKTDLNTAADLVSYRYSAGEEDNGVTVSGDVDIRSQRVTSLSYGVAVREDTKALRTIEPLHALHDVSYELRILRVAGLLTQAYWLKSLSAGNQADAIVPYSTPIRELNPKDPNAPKNTFSVADFFAILTPYAQRALEYDDSPRADGKPSPVRPTAK